MLFYNKSKIKKLRIINSVNNSSNCYSSGMLENLEESLSWPSLVISLSRVQLVAYLCPRNASANAS